MSIFLPAPDRIVRLETIIETLKARLNAISIGGSLRLDPSTPIGSLPAHTHEGAAQGGWIVFNGGSSGKIDFLGWSTSITGLPATGKSLRNFGSTGNNFLTAIGADGAVRAIEMEVASGAPSSTRKEGSIYWDSTNDQFWINNNSSTGWTLIGPVYAAAAACNSDLALTTTMTDVPGMTITVPNAGTYEVIVSFYAIHDGTAGKTIGGQLVVDGSAESIQLRCQIAAISQTTITQVWKITTAGANKVVKMQANYSPSGGSPTLSVKATHSNMVISGNGASAPPSGGTIIVQEDDANIDTAVGTLDFTEPDATLVTSSPAGEANVNMALYPLLAGRSGAPFLHVDSARVYFYMGVPSGNPGMALDNNDYWDYNEANNFFRWLIGGVEKVRIDSNADITIGRDIILTRYLNAASITNSHVYPIGTDSAFFLGLDAGLYMVAFDNADYLDFVRASNLFRLSVAGAVVFDCDGSGNIHPRGNITMDSAKTVDGVDVSALSGVANQTANTHFAGPASGGAASPTFRALVAADIPVSTLFSFHNYTNVPDAAVDAVITAADQQGIIHHSGPADETATKLYADAETAPGASGLPVTWKYGDTDDLDTVASWTTIATLTLSSEKTTNTSSMTNATIPHDRLIQCNIGTIVGSPKNATSSLRVKRPLSA